MTLPSGGAVKAREETMRAEGKRLDRLKVGGDLSTPAGPRCDVVFTGHLGEVLHHFHVVGRQFERPLVGLDGLGIQTRRRQDGTEIEVRLVPVGGTVKCLGCLLLPGTLELGRPECHPHPRVAVVRPDGFCEVAAGRKLLGYGVSRPGAARRDHRRRWCGRPGLVRRTG